MSGVRDTASLGFLASELCVMAARTEPGAAEAAVLNVAARLARYLKVRARAETALWRDLLRDARAQCDALREHDEAFSLVEAIEASEPVDLQTLKVLLASTATALMAHGDERSRLALHLLRLEACFDCGIIDAARSQEDGAPQVRDRARNNFDIDPRAMEGFLGTVLPANPSIAITRCETLSAGFSKSTVLMDLAPSAGAMSQLIVRADAGGTYGGMSVADEFDLYQALFVRGIRVPQPLAADKAGKLFGTPLMVTERVDGNMLGHIFQLPVPNPLVAIDIARQLAAIHQTPLDALPPSIDNIRGTNGLKAREWIGLARRDFEALAMPSAVYAAAFAFLEANAGLTDAMPRRLVHGDVHLSNMLVADNEVKALIDWEFAHVGNPAYDLGYFYHQAVALGGWEPFIKAYAEAGGPVPGSLQLDYAILLGLARVGVMICQTLKEFRTEPVPGVGGAMVTADMFYEQGIARMQEVLERLL